MAAGIGPGFRRFHPAPDARTTLFCFPHAGGSAAYFLAMARALPPSVEAIAVEYPGRQERFGEPGVDDLIELSTRTAAEIRAVIDRPFAFFGHSMGATVAFEAARVLQDDGIVPLALFASGRKPPSLCADSAAPLTDDELVAEMKRLGGTDPRLLDNEDMRSVILPAIRSDYQAVRTYRYRPGPPLDCPVVALTGDADPLLTVAEADVWERHTARGFTRHVFPGDHFYLDRHRAAVAEVITGTLDGIASQLR